MDLGRFARCALGCSLIAGCSIALSPLGHAEGKRDKNIREIDHYVPHVSTVPANAGKPVKLFVRELVRKRGDDDDDDDDDDDRRGSRKRGDDRDGQQHQSKAVLLIHGASTPVLAGFQLAHKHHNWSLKLAKAGFDVFMLDLQGSGRSPRTAMDDPCNAPVAQQTELLIPSPLAQTCAPSFPFVLVNAQSDWDELDTVVDYIRAYRGLDKVALAGWSHASVRIGPYAVQHPEKVDRILLLAPIFGDALPAARQVGDSFLPPYARTPQGGVRACTAQELATSTCPADVAPSELFISGTPMTLRTRRANLGDPWQAEIACENQVEEGIDDVVWKAIRENDAIGRTWGPPPDSPEGLMRVRTFALWAWNSRTAGKISVPMLLIGGELDTQAPPASLAQLYSAIANELPKLLFKVACTGHYMPWERQARVLHQVSKQWLKHGSVEGHSTGKFLVTTDGDLVPMD